MLIAKCIPEYIWQLRELFSNKRYAKLSFVEKISIPPICKRMNITVEECFLFDFYHLNIEEQESYLSDALVGEIAWGKSDKSFFDKNVKDKYAFFCLHETYFNRKAIKVSKKYDFDTFKSFCRSRPVFVKPLDKSMGSGAFVYDYDVNTIQDTFNEMLSSGDEWIVEERISQHPIMAEWNQSSLNTVRVPTILCNDGTFHVMGTFMRTGRKGYVVDNAAAGGIFAVVDSDTGVVITEGIDKDGHTFERHPESELVFKKYQLPQWDKCLELVEQAHRQILPNIKYLAYDVAYTEKGWVLVEANCGQFVSQFATKKGLKKEFLEYMNR